MQMDLLYHLQVTLSLLLCEPDRLQVPMPCYHSHEDLDLDVLECILDSTCPFSLVIEIPMLLTEGSNINANRMPRFIRLKKRKMFFRLFVEGSQKT